VNVKKEIPAIVIQHAEYFVLDICPYIGKFLSGGRSSKVINNDFSMSQV
jgi:hypothetical protein